MPTKENRKKGCMLGLAIGDVIDTLVEFKKRGAFLPEGQWKVSSQCL